jgi:hypothetical protein
MRLKRLGWGIFLGGRGRLRVHKEAVFHPLKWYNYRVISGIFFIS